jgi:hypothetical protein
MSIIKSSLRVAVICAAITCVMVYVIKQQLGSKNFGNHRDHSGIHMACKSQLEGKIHGLACSLCRSKWSDLKPSKSLQDGIIEYAERKYGKKVSNFSNAETMEVYQMLFD